MTLVRIQSIPFFIKNKNYLKINKLNKRKKERKKQRRKRETNREREKQTERKKFYC